MALSVHNSLTRVEENFVPIHTEYVGMYTCGPTVYDYVTVGNWRTYTLGDIVARTLTYTGYNVKYFMNITDVGHLTGDNEGNADTGVDRMEKAKLREGKNAWDIAKFYTEDFMEGYKKLNLTLPEQFLKATDYISEQISLVEKLMENGLAYKINDGVYFDTVAYEAKGFTYGELSNLDQIKAGARVEMNTEKRNPRDFALWKSSPTDEKRDMEWDSPWGVGFPGWHIECSAMSMKFLGEQFDIHVGGEDLKSTHHPNEIAQSQGATGTSPFVKYWIHGAFLQIDGGRMGKSLGNAYTLHDLEKNGFEPLALRYFYFTAHYTSPLNFTWDALRSAQTALQKMQRKFANLKNEEPGSIVEQYKNQFTTCISDDFNMPRALAVCWGLLADKAITDEDKRATLLDFDTVLGFKL
jgi:cysteinyl-tRNA synthetase